jgi:hypothetical protein
MILLELDGKTNEIRMKHLKLYEEWKLPSWLIELSDITACCDACGHEEAIDLKDYTAKNVDDLLGKECPDCGNIMIDQNDVNKFKKALKYLHRDHDKHPEFIGVNLRTKKHTGRKSIKKEGDVDPYGEENWGENVK